MFTGNHHLSMAHTYFSGAGWEKRVAEVESASDRSNAKCRIFIIAVISDPDIWISKNAAINEPNLSGMLPIISTGDGVDNHSV